uniref:Uncharacterized protein n=1 Tax=Caenorhabditis japonica TaxID=281687 RepID=A0A8R1IPD5_CAEJA
MNPAYVNDWQITYLFAITNKTTDTQLDNLVKYVSDPLKDCDGQSLVVRILARNNSDSDWMTDVNKVGPYLEQLRNDEVLIAGDDHTLLYGNDKVTYELVLKAVSSAPHYNEDVKPPRVTLLTDFVSDTFVTQYNQTLLPLLERYDFSIIAFTQEAYDGYKSKLAMKSSQIINDGGYGYSKELKMCEKPVANVTTIMLIIIGTCSGVMLILILLTVLYRQKYMWMRKLK